MHDEWRMLAALLCFSIGIGVYFALSFEPPLSVIISLATLSTGLVLTFKKSTPILRNVLIAIMLILLGLTLAQIRSQIIAAPILDREFASGLSGTVVSLEKRAAGHTVLTLQNVVLTRANISIPSNLGLRLTVRTQIAANLQPGEGVRTFARLGPPSGPVMPGAFDFARLSWFRGIGGIGIALAPVERSGQANKTFMTRVQHVRDTVANKAQNAIEGEAGALAGALLAGSRGRLSEKFQDQMRDAGLAHVLAISGLHLGLMTTVIFFCVQKILSLFPALVGRYPARKPAAIIALLGALGYLALSGFSLPTQRAFVMVSIGIIAVLADRKVLSLRSVILAAFAVLITQPESLMTVGFQMSFAAVAALIVIYERFGNRLISLMRQRRGLWPRIGTFIIGSMVTTLIAEIAIAPFAIYHFNTVALYGIAANMIVIPLMSFWIMPAALVMLILMPFGLEHMAAPLLEPALNIVIYVARDISAVPGATLHLPRIPDIGMAVLLLGLLCAVIVRGRVAALPTFIGLTALMIVWRSDILPHIVIDEGGRLFTVNEQIDDNDQLLFNQKYYGKYAQEKWRAIYGGPISGPRKLLSAKCDLSGCIYITPSGLTIAKPSSLFAFRQDCGRVDIIITDNYWGRVCANGKSFILDRTQLSGQGPLALFPARGGHWQIISAAEIQGYRPWSSYRSNKIKRASRKVN